MKNLIRNFFAFCAILVFSSALLAQKQTVVIKSGKIVEGKLFKERYYFLPEFSQGVMKYSDGSIFKGNMNIDVFKQTVSVVTDKKDTITLPEKPEIESVIIGKNTFRKVKNLIYQVIYDSEKFALVVNKNLKIVSKNVAGAYGTTTDNAALSVLNSVSSNNQIESLSEPVTYSFTYDEKVQIMSPDGKTSTLNKNKLIALFPEKKDLIEKFIADNKSDLSKIKDVIPLFNLITGQ